MFLSQPKTFPKKVAPHSWGIIQSHLLETEASNETHCACKVVSKVKHVDCPESETQHHRIVSRPWSKRVADLKEGNILEVSMINQSQSWL